jgi:hypothetical protein
LHKKLLAGIFLVVLTQAAMAQAVLGVPQRLPPEQEYELMKEFFHTLKRSNSSRTYVWTAKMGELNPFDFATLTEPLLFINGQDAAQVAKAAEMLGARNGALKIIVVGPLGKGVSSLPKGKLYSDYKGKLAKKIGIQNGPALVTQEGRQLRIEEIVP